MHIAVISFTDVDYGTELASALHEQGQKVTLILARSYAAKAMGGAERLRERFYEVGLIPPQVDLALYDLPRMRDLASYTVMRRIAAAVRDAGADVAHVVMGGGEIWTPVLAWLLRPLPVASTMIIPKPNRGEYPPALVVAVTNHALSRASDVIVVNGKDHVSLVHERYRVPATRVIYVPLGPRAAFRTWSKEEVPLRHHTALFFGRINEHKGFEYLVRAQPLISRRFPDARILIAGKGPELERCRPLMADPAAFEIHDGYVTGDLADRLFQEAAVVTVPYLSAATSGVLMTAYVYGKPVVATRVGSLPEYVNDGVTGLLIPPADVEALADAVCRLFGDEGLRSAMGASAAEWVGGELSWASVAQQHIAAYERAIAAHGSRR